jgi:hypothetical protein
MRSFIKKSLSNIRNPILLWDISFGYRNKIITLKVPIDYLINNGTKIFSFHFIYGMPNGGMFASSEQHFT